MQFIFTVTYIGCASNPQWNSLWTVGTVFYATGFVLFGVEASMKVQARKKNEHPPQLLPWRKLNVYGAHEDFHLLVVLGDITYFMNAVFNGFEV